MSFERNPPTVPALDPAERPVALDPAVLFLRIERNAEAQVQVLRRLETLHRALCESRSALHQLAELAVAEDPIDRRRATRVARVHLDRLDRALDHFGAGTVGISIGRDPDLEAAALGDGELGA